MKRITLVLLALLLCAGCAKKATAPVPGSTSTADATAFRVLADAQAALHSVKTWQQCSVHNFPAAVDIDGASEPCDQSAGQFPDKYKAPLNTAINSYSALAGIAKAVHDGTSTDTAALKAAEDKLTNDVSTLISTVKGGQ
jgi:outer membrane murein-binding lipoprotein Lpp